MEAVHTEIEDMLAVTSLMTLLALANPSTRSEYARLLCRTVKIKLGSGQDDKQYEVTFRKNALQFLRNTLQGSKGDKDLLVPGLIDEVSALMIQFRHKMCLDCVIGGYGRSESGPPPVGSAWNHYVVPACRALKK